MKRAACSRHTAQLVTKEIANMTTFTLTSPDIPAGGTIAPVFESDMFGCGGANASPVLQWSGAPEGTQSFAVTVYDPDAPTGSGWWHWMVVDIPASVTSLAANAGKKAVPTCPQARAKCATTTAFLRWGGMCPPPGDKPHRYIFTVHALSVAKLDMPDDATTAIGGFMINANTIAKASFTSTYARA